MDDIQQEEFLDICAHIQMLTDLNDTEWKEKFGNDKGLLGFVEVHTRQALERLEDRLLDKSIALMNEETAVKWDDVHDTIEAELKALQHPGGKDDL